MVVIAEIYNEKTSLNEYIDCKVHNLCPVCNHVMQPQILVLDKKELYKPVKRSLPSFGVEKFDYIDELVGYATDIVLKCKAYECGSTFIAHYKSEITGMRNSVWKSQLIGLSPSTKPIPDINTSLEEISQDFYSIYEEALIAETKGLSQICGMGYRKALEFLIKDYVIFIKGNEIQDQEAFLTKDLGKILAHDIESAKIVSMARRATWLGNDEAHYKRKWIEKDTQDLKAMIKVVVNEMENEIIFRKTMEEMPKGR